MDSDARYDLKELAARAGVTARTVHFYIQQGLLPPAGQPGPGARYSEAHLARLVLIRRLQREHLPLAEIRQRLGALTDEAVLDLAASASKADEAPSPPDSSALDYIRGVLGQSTASSTPPMSPASPSSRVPPSPPSAAPSPSRAAAPSHSLLRDHLTVLARHLHVDKDELSRRWTEPLLPSPVVPERSQWDRIVLSPDIELHIRRPLTREQNKRVERLLQTAKAILQEEDL